MKNIKVYDYFLDNMNYSFKVKYFKISLLRTFIFNINDNNIFYYRKANVSRKILLVGKEKSFLLKRRINFDKVDYNKYGIRNINNLLFEYISTNHISNTYKNKKFDIVEKNKKKIITSDSVIRKYYRDEMVTMCFEENSLSNLIINDKLKKQNKDNFSNVCI